MNGVLIIDKPAGLTSHDVVNRIRRLLDQHSVGHLGTLDPMATGVLPIVVGNFTRLAQFYVSSEKTYEGTIRFGFCTDTYDAEGEPTTEVKDVSLQADEVDAAAGKFRGVIEQVPPPFSAKKIKGVPAYKLARKHKEVSLKPVQVEIKELEVLGVDIDRMRFRARVSSGTYVRSVAHELGKALGCGAHLESLRRVGVAEFSVAQAHTLDELSGKLMDAGRQGTVRKDFQALGSAENIADSRLQALLEVFVHPRELLPSLPSVTADELAASRIRLGQTVNLPELSRAPLIKVFVGQRNLIAIARRVAGTLFHPKIVLCGT